MKNLSYRKVLNSKENTDLIAYASAFVSFVLPKIEVKEIILFGSVARGEAEKGSDIDLFFDVDGKEEETKRILSFELGKFNKSKIAEVWSLKGIENSMSLNIGKLEEWKLKRSIISEGITLYGKHRELPEKLRAFAFFNIEPIKVIKRRNRLIRKLFGRTEGKYSTNGIIDEFGGKKISPTSFIVPLEKSKDIVKILGDEKVNYMFFEIWSDNLNIKV